MNGEESPVFGARCEEDADEVGGDRARFLAGLGREQQALGEDPGEVERDRRSLLEDLVEVLLGQREELAGGVEPCGVGVDLAGQKTHLPQAVSAAQERGDRLLQPLLNQNAHLARGDEVEGFSGVSLPKQDGTLRE